MMTGTMLLPTWFAGTWDIIEAKALQSHLSKCLDVYLKIYEYQSEHLWRIDEAVT